MASWTYLLVSNHGEVYLGATTSLKRRLGEHNSEENAGWTRGRTWRLLDARRFDTKEAAFAFEYHLKRHPHEKVIWKVSCWRRAARLAAREGRPFLLEAWVQGHRADYVQRGLRQADQRRLNSAAGFAAAPVDSDLPRVPLPVAMPPTRALDILRALADGVDPFTGEVFEGDSPYRRPEAVRALWAGIDALETVWGAAELSRWAPVSV